jgi:hypothetical protein
MNATERAVDAYPATEWQKVYAEALSISDGLVGTVCVDRQHYESGRHLEPYRMGYHHKDHWHAAYDEYTGCRP